MKKANALIAAVMVAALCLSGCGRSQEVKETEQAISDIGEVSLEKEKQITEARAKYDALQNGENNKVRNYYVLMDAEEKLLELKRSALVGMWQTTLYGAKIVVDFKADGTFKFYFDAIFSIFGYEETEGNYTFDGTEIQFNSENEISAVVTTNSLILSMGELGLGDLFFTRYE